MKKFLLTILMLIAVVPLWALEFEVNGIRYISISTTNKTVSVGEATSSSPYSGDITIPTTVTYNGTTYSVIKIGVSAFHDSGITRISIPNSVIEIGSNAFSGCSDLTEVIIPNSVTSIGEYAFKNCSSLTSVTIPNSVTSISDGTFHNSGITSISIPNTVTTIGNYAFRQCSGLTELVIPNSVTSIGKSAFDYCSGLISVSIPNSVTTINDNSFALCTSLKHISIEDGTTTLTLGTSIFNNTPFETLYLGRNVSYSSKYSPFANKVESSIYKNESLISVEIGKNVTEVPNYLFYNCMNVYSITIGAGVLRIGTNQSKPIKTIFLGNTQPTNWAQISGTEMNYASKEYATGFKVYSSLNSMFEVDGIKYVPVSLSERTCEAIDCAYNNSCENVYIGKTVSYRGIDLTVEYINPYTCYNNKYVNTCNIPYKKDIGKYAFYGCSNIIETILDVNKIEEHAFDSSMSSEDASLEIIANTIEVYAFSSAKSIASATINADLIDENAFHSSMQKNPATLSLTARNIGTHSFTSTTAIQTANIVVTDSIPEGAFASSMSKESASLDVKTPIISDFAFSYTSSLNYANIEADTIKRSAFDGSGIIDLKILDCVKSIGISCFANNASLTSVDIGSGLKEIPDNVFYSCYNLQGITIPENIDSVGNWVFSRCTNLANVIISDSEKELRLGSNYGNSTKDNLPMFGSCKLDYVYIGRNITYNTTSDGGYSPFFSNEYLRKVVNTSREKDITAKEFEDCTNLQEVQLDEGVQSLANNAFKNCNTLKSIILPNSITSSIGESCFSDCSSLTNILIGTGIPAINDNALQNCSSLAQINIPNNVDSINNNVFAGCTSLKIVVFEEKDSELTLGFNSNSSPMFVDCPLDSVYIGRNLSYNESNTHGYSPFYHNTTLRTVLITDFENAILENEFYLCTGLTTVRIGNGVESIGNWAFSGCQSLEYWEFGSGLKTIGKEAFSDCEKVAKIYSNTATPPVCGSQALDDIDKWNCTLYIPKGTATAYSSAEQWKEFLFVEESDFTPTQSISINSDLSTVYVGEEFTIPVIITPEDCSTKKLLWTSSDENVLAVDKNGVITAKSRGSATITVATTDGTNLSASKDFKVSVLNLGSMGLHFNVLSSKEKTVEVTSIARNEATGTTYYYIGSIYIPSEVNVRGEDYRVVSIGENAFERSQGLTSVSIPNSVTKISQYAFYACSGLTSIILPDSVATIETAAFHSCSNLETIEFGKQLTTLGSNILNSCSNLTSVKVNSSTPATAAENTFNGIPSSVILYVPLASDIEKYSNAIGWNKFTSIQASKKLVESITLNKSSLSLVVGEQYQLNATVSPSDATNTTITWSSSNTAVATISNSGIVTAIGEGTASITATTTDGTNIVAECTIKVEKKKVVNNIYYNLSLDNKTATVTYAGNTAIEENDEYSGNIVIPESIKHNDVTYTITEIGDSAFKYCNKITSVSVPNTLETVGCYSFAKSQIAEIKLPSTLKRIHNGAFAKCNNLTEIEIPQNISSLNDSTFNECSNLKTVILPKGLKDINVRVFNHCSSLENITLPESLTFIGTGAFANCTQLKTITIPSAVTALNNVVFSNCSALQQITILGEITAIKNSALQDCISLTEIVIPKSVTSIEKYAFFRCLTLSKVVVESETPPTAKSTSFNNIPTDAILYVPNKNAMNLYREATGWNTFTKMRVVDVVDFEPGDANCDKSLSVTDVVMLANAIMGENSNEFNEFAADANCDGVISVSDIVCTANVIMSGTELANTSQASIIPFNVQKTSLSVNEVAIARGETKQINIKLNNAIDFTAFQVDLELPNGLTIENSSLSLQGNSSHILYANEIGENVHRFMSFSMTNKKLNCDNELLLTIDVVANDDFIGGMLNLNNILLVNREGKEFMLKNISSTISSTNSISNTIYNNVNIYAQGKNIVIENTDVENAYIYTIDGAIKIEQLQPGYNVIEMNKMGMYIVKVGDKTDKVLIY